MKAIIVAVDEAGGIGKNGNIPWYFSEDLKFFSKTTKNSTCVMGRKTYEDIFSKIKNPNQLLPHRESFVLSNNNDYEPVGATLVKTLQGAFNKASYDDVYIIGGSGVYYEALPFIDSAIISYIPGVYDCDVFIHDILTHVYFNFYKEYSITVKTKDDQEIIFTKYKH